MICWTFGFARFATYLQFFLSITLFGIEAHPWPCWTSRGIPLNQFFLTSILTPIPKIICFLCFFSSRPSPGLLPVLGPLGSGTDTTHQPSPALRLLGCWWSQVECQIYTIESGQKMFYISRANIKKIFLPAVL